MSKIEIRLNEKEKVFLSGYKNFSVKRAGILTCPWPKLGARFEVEDDLSVLFPYINGTIDSAKFYNSPKRVQLVFKGAQCTLYRHEIIAAVFKDYDDAHLFSERLVAYLNDLYEKRQTIEPDYNTIEPLSAIDIYKLLPKSNCRECGYASCLAFAAALSKGKCTSAQCPGFSKPIEEKAVYPVFDNKGNLASTIELKIPPQQNESSIPDHILTDRELQVLQLLAGGATNPAISETLFISPHTVKTHVNHIYEKLGVNDRAQAAVWASRHNII